MFTAVDTGDINNQSNSTQMKCDSTFFFSNGTCLPQCGKWKQYSDSDSIIVDAVSIISATTGVGFGILVLLLSSIWWKKMYVVHFALLYLRTI